MATKEMSHSMLPKWGFAYELSSLEPHEFSFLAILNNNNNNNTNAIQISVLSPGRKVLSYIRRKWDGSSPAQWLEYSWIWMYVHMLALGSLLPEPKTLLFTQGCVFPSSLQFLLIPPQLQAFAFHRQAATTGKTPLSRCQPPLLWKWAIDRRACEKEHSWQARQHGGGSFKYFCLKPFMAMKVRISTSDCVQKPIGS